MDKKQEAMDLVQGCRNSLCALQTCFESIGRDEPKMEMVLFGAGMGEIFGDIVDRLNRAHGLIEEI
jgi:hypothetical protein